MAATYAALKSEIKDYTTRDDLEADYNTDLIVRAIAAAEERLNRVLVTPEREASTAIAAVDGVVTLPADFWGIRSAFLDESPKIVLEQLTLHELRTMHATDEGGKARHFAISGDEMLLGPASDDTVTITYYQTIPALSDAQTSNWLLASHSDLYLQMALVEIYQLTRDNDGMQVAESRAQSIINEIKKAGHNKEYGSAPLAPSPRRGHASRTIRW